MDFKDIRDIIRLNAKCLLIERGLYENSDLLIHYPGLEIHVDKHKFDEIADAFSVKTIVYNPTWNYSDKDYGEEYFYVTLFKQKFKIFALWEKENDISS